MFYIKQQSKSGLITHGEFVESVEDIPTIEEAIELMKQHAIKLIDNILVVEQTDQKELDEYVSEI